jgi:hypothetical protein
LHVGLIYQYIGKYNELRTYSFYELEGFRCLLLLFFLGSTILLHRGQPLGDIVLVAFAGFMRPDAERIVRYEDLAQVAPFVPLAHPILNKRKTGKGY